MLTTGAMCLAVRRGQQTWYHFGSVATFAKHVTATTRYNCTLPIRHFYSSSVLYIAAMQQAYTFYAVI